jgi:hypothetical protein
MSQITCNHCNKAFDEENHYCPACQAPTPAQQDRELAAIKRKVILFIAGLTIFCAIMILWLPRNIP